VPNEVKTPNATEGLALQEVGCALEVYPEVISGRLLIATTAAAPATSSADELGLAVVDLDQKRISPLKIAVPKASFAAFSTDGTEVIFTVGRGAEKIVRTADWDGTNVAPVANSTGFEVGGLSGDTLTLFKPDGTAILVEKLGTGRFDAATQKRVTLPPRISEARLSPDRASLLFSTSKFWPGADLCIRALSSNLDSCPLSGAKDFRGGRWNKSGELIAYTSGDEVASGIAVLNQRSKIKSVLVDTEGRNTDPAWNPNGEGVAFVNEVDDGTKLMFQDAAGKPPLPLASCIGKLRLLDWSGPKTITVEALRVKRALER
jgi:Tol biopolymer transport system component